MHAELQRQASFYLGTGRMDEDPGALEGLGLRPALLAAYRDLSRLRYDFPLVLLAKGADGAFAEPLGELFERALKAHHAQGVELERLRAYALGLELAIRALLGAGAGGTLAALLEQGARRLAPGSVVPSAETLRQWRVALAAEGEIVDCTAALPERLIAHAWRAAQQRKAESLRSHLERLTVKLADILRADHAGSAAARTPASLRDSMGALHADAFDFEVLSGLLGKVPAEPALSGKRRRRIESTLEALRSQRFFALSQDGAGAYEFRFGDCAAALAAFRERLPEVARLARAIAIAELEIEGEFSGPRHDALFERLAQSELDPRDLAMFPDYLVCVNAARLDAREQACLQEILAGGLPMKVLVQSDDVLDEPLSGVGHAAFGARSRQLAGMALALNEVSVLQAAASHLPRLRERIGQAMKFPGPALFSVYSGVSGYAPGLPPYLVAAAAAESRAFPAFAYDPAAGPDWASRFSLDGNPQPDRDWPLHALDYEDPEHQRVSEPVEFTVADFAACDRRYAKHFSKVPRTQGRESVAPAAAIIAGEPKRLPDKLPSLLMVDSDNCLQRVIVDDRLIVEARRCRDAWRSLQELGGIRNSHAERLLARERTVWEAKQAALAAAPLAAPAQALAGAPPQAAVAKTEAAPAAAPEPATERPPDEPYIETPRCSSCDECIQLNPKMFAYDGNKQARIVNASAGTYRQLVEAAESCQVAVIHPGKPKNPNEPGLDELLKRAEAFQ